MKYLLTTFITIFLSLSAFSQNVTWSKVFGVSNTENIAEILGNDEFYFVITNTTSKLQITKFDNSLSFIMNKEFDLASNEISSIKQVKLAGDKIYAAAISDANNELSVQFITLNLNLEIEGTREVTSHKYESDRNKGAFKFSISPNEKNILVMEELPKVKDRNEEISLMAFTHEEGLIWQKKIDTKYPGKLIRHNKSFIDNKGSGYVLKRFKGPKGFTFKLYCFDVNAGKAVAKTIKLDNKKIGEIDATFNQSDQLVVTGFYGGDSFEIYKGIFYFLYKSDGTQIKKYYDKIGVSYLAKFIGKKAASKDGAGLSDFYITDLVSVSDDKTIIIAEKNKDFWDNSKKGKFRIFESGDLALLCLGKDGNVVWKEIINKNQNSFNDNSFWNSYNYLTTDKAIYIYGNEVNSTVKEPQNGPYNVLGDMVTLKGDEIAVLKSNYLKNHPNKGMILVPSKGLRKNNELVFVVSNKEKSKVALGKLNH